jgi:quinol monooxygenase YgiN
MLAGGVAWVSVLSTLTVAAQQASPPWVRARALAVYLIVFQAGIAGGSVLWGEVASRAGLRAAYFGIAGGLVLAGALAARLRLAADAGVDHSPAHHWAEPVAAGEPELDAGPVMIQVECYVDPAQSDAFRMAMEELGGQRRRNGAEQWWLFQDAADPSRFVETWLESTWAEHLRYHERVSVEHKEIERRAHALVRSGSTITTRHFIAPASGPSADDE